MVLVTVFENGWGPDELAAKLGRVLDLNGWRNRLESQLVSILAEATQAANGKQAIAGSTRLPASFYRVSCARVSLSILTSSSTARASPISSRAPGAAVTTPPPAAGGFHIGAANTLAL